MQTTPEALWNSGKYTEYFEAARTHVVESLRGKALTPELLDEAGQVVNRTVPSPASLGSQIDIAAKTDIVTELLNYDFSRAPDSQRGLQKKVQEISQAYVESLQKEIIPNYQAQQVVANISPPAGTPNAMPGMNPKAIADPALRAQYEAAIKANGDASFNNTRQAFLQRSLAKMAPAIQFFSESHGAPAARPQARQISAAPPSSSANAALVESKGDLKAAPTPSDQQIAKKSSVLPASEKSEPSAQVASPKAGPERGLSLETGKTSSGATPLPAQTTGGSPTVFGLSPKALVLGVGAVSGVLVLALFFGRRKL